MEAPIFKNIYLSKPARGIPIEGGTLCKHKEFALKNLYCIGVHPFLLSMTRLLQPNLRIARKCYPTEIRLVTVGPSLGRPWMCAIFIYVL